MLPQVEPAAGRDSRFLSVLQPGYRALAASGPAWLFPGEAARRIALPAPAGRAAALEVRLAETSKEVRRAQRLRYKVFFEEMAAVPSPVARLSRRDADAFDAICDHLVVLDHAVAPKPFRKPKPKVVGTYRLLRREVAEAALGFYSAREFDLAPLLATRPDLRLVELGRSCVLKPYRSKKTVDLLWQGIWAYVTRHGCEAMIGCASLPGTDPHALALPLSYLHHHAPSPAEWRVRALPGRHSRMDLLPREAVDVRAAFKTLPPLVKGYLRVGATVGDGAVIDRAFGTTDVFVLMPISEMRGRYVDHFGPAANRAPA